MPIKREKQRIALNLRVENVDFMHRTHGRPMDDTNGRFNWSEIVDDLVDRFIADLDPAVATKILEEERQDLLRRLRDLQARIAAKAQQTTLEAVATRRR